MAEISPSQLKQLLEQTEERPVLLDCREQVEFDLVHLEEVLHIPMSELVDRHQELTEWQQSHVVVYCHHGIRSLRVAGWLRQNGFEKVESLAGGIDAWAEQLEPEMTRY